jgi:hypothetical protein
VRTLAPELPIERLEAVALAHVALAIPLCASF